MHGCALEARGGAGPGSSDYHVLSDHDLLCVCPDGEGESVPELYGPGLRLLVSPSQQHHPVTPGRQQTTRAQPGRSLPAPSLNIS